MQNTKTTKWADNGDGTYVIEGLNCVDFLAQFDSMLENCESSKLADDTVLLTNKETGMQFVVITADGEEYVYTVKSVIDEQEEQIAKADELARKLITQVTCVLDLEQHKDIKSYVATRLAELLEMDYC